MLYGGVCAAVVVALATACHENGPTTQTAKTTTDDDDLGEVEQPVRETTTVVKVDPSTARLGTSVQMTKVEPLPDPAFTFKEAEHSPVSLNCPGGASDPLTGVSGWGTKQLTGTLPQAHACSTAQETITFGQSDLVGIVLIETVPGEGIVERQGTFRLELTGFTVNRETYDTLTEGDGKGDEVFIKTSAARVDMRPGYGETRVEPPADTKVFGDINGFPDRIQAGSRSAQGGLKTTDPVNLSNTPTLPLTLWEGKLVQGRDGALIAPMIWEWDGDGTHSTVDHFGNAYSADNMALTTLGAVRNALLGRAQAPVPAVGPMGPDLTIIQSEFVSRATGGGFAITRNRPGWPFGGTPGQRPIGLVYEGDKTVFRPWLVALTYEVGVLASRLPTSISLPHVDDRDWLEGDYDVALRITVVDEGPAP